MTLEALSVHPRLVFLVALLLMGSCAAPSGQEASEAAACVRDPGIEEEFKVPKCWTGERCLGQMPHPSCPATPSDAPSLCSLFGEGYRASRVPCGSGVLVWWSGGTQGFECLYDAAGSLVGTRSVIDSPSFCRFSSTWTWGMTIPSCARPTAPNICAP
jgi:hypothetical protein